MDATKQPGLRIGQIFLSTAHFEHRDDALSIPPGTNVEIGINISGKVEITEDGLSGLITLAVNSRDELNPLYRFRIEMVGVIQSDPEERNLMPLEYLSQQGPAMMFPFVREAIANLTGRGRFGAMWLAPFNIQAATTQSQVGNSVD